VSLAACTGHMIATFGLFDWCLTLWAPFVLFRVFLLEFLEVIKFSNLCTLTPRAAVPRLFAPKAVNTSTSAAHTSLAFEFASRTLDLRFTVGCWTPLLVSVFGYILDIFKFKILL